MLVKSDFEVETNEMNKRRDASVNQVRKNTAVLFTDKRALIIYRG